MIYFTSDNHFNDPRIIQACDRPYSSVDEMNLDLVERWNATVSPEDHVYHLGDFCQEDSTIEDVAAILDMLNFKTLVFTKGNHDPLLHQANVAGFFWDRKVQLRSDMRFPYNGDHYHCYHFPLAIWEEAQHGSYHPHGHVHGTYKNAGRSWDVGVDNNDYYPVSIDKVKELCDINNVR